MFPSLFQKWIHVRICRKIKRLCRIIRHPDDLIQNWCQCLLVTSIAIYDIRLMCSPRNNWNVTSLFSQKIFFEFFKTFDWHGKRNCGPNFQAISSNSKFISIPGYDKTFCGSSFFLIMLLEVYFHERRMPSKFKRIIH